MPVLIQEGLMAGECADDRVVEVVAEVEQLRGALREIELVLASQRTPSVAGKLERVKQIVEAALR